MAERGERSVSICITGHRPGKLWGYDLDTVIYAALKAEMKKVTIGLIKESRAKRIHMMTGMALGADQLFFEIAEELKEEDNFGAEIFLEACVPFEGYESKWPNESKDKFYEMLEKADKVTYVSPPGYSSQKMHERNHYMVDRCDYLIAVYNGCPGGTSKCVEYAKKKGKKVLLIDPFDVEDFLTASAS